MTFTADIRASYGAPCACHAEAADNPPRRRRNPPEPNTAGILAAYDMLGAAAAVGALAEQLGMPEGAALIDRVVTFAAASPTLNAAEGGRPATLETAGLADAAKRIGGSAGKVLGKVEERAARYWKQLGSQSDLLFKIGLVTGGTAAAIAYFEGAERVEAAAIAAEKALVGETLLRLSPQEAVAALKNTQLLSGTSGTSWLKWGAIGLALFIAWRLLGPVVGGSR